MIPIGLSISDLALAVKVIYKVCGVFRDASSANQQYASTITFLDAFARTFGRMIEYTESTTLAPDNKSLSDDLTVQMRLIYAEYINFDNYLKKAEPGLSSNSITSRLAARAKWALKELDEKVEGLKRAVIAPMMLVTPLLAVEVLRELKDIKAQLPATASYEAAIRHNSALILQTNSDIAHLRSNIDAWWWNRRWAMSAIEKDIETLKVVVKNNTDLIEHSRTAVQESVSRDTQRQAASNIEAITVLETVMAARLATIEGQIDQLIYDTRIKTGKDDKELSHIKARLATSRYHLHQASKSARQCLKSFGLLVIAIDEVHSNLLPTGMLPFAKKLVGYNKIYEAGQKFVKFGGQTIENGSKSMQSSDLLEGLKSWSPFAAGADEGKIRLEDSDRTSAINMDTEKSSAMSRPEQQLSEKGHGEAVMQDEGYDSAEEPTARSTQVTAPSMIQVSPDTLTRSTFKGLQGQIQSQEARTSSIALSPTNAPQNTNVGDLLLFDADYPEGAGEVRSIPPRQPSSSQLQSSEPVSGLHDNPWA